MDNVLDEYKEVLKNFPREFEDKAFDQFCELDDSSLHDIILSKMVFNVGNLVKKVFDEDIKKN